MDAELGQLDSLCDLPGNIFSGPMDYSQIFTEKVSRDDKSMDDALYWHPIDCTSFHLVLYLITGSEVYRPALANLFLLDRNRIVYQKDSPVDIPDDFRTNDTFL